MGKKKITEIKDNFRIEIDYGGFGGFDKISYKVDRIDNSDAYTLTEEKSHRVYYGYDEEKIIRYLNQDIGWKILK